MSSYLLNHEGESPCRFYKQIALVQFSNRASGWSKQMAIFFFLKVCDWLVDQPVWQEELRSCMKERGVPSVTTAGILMLQMLSAVSWGSNEPSQPVAVARLAKEQA